MKRARRDEVDRRIRALWVRGPDRRWPTDRALAEVLGLSPRTVAAYRRRLGLYVRTAAGWTEAHDRRLRSLWVVDEDGRWPTDRELAEALGVTPSTIVHRRSDLGLSRVRTWTGAERRMIGALWDRQHTDREIVDAIARRWPSKPRPTLSQVGKLRREMNCFRDGGRGSIRDYATSSLHNELERRGETRWLRQARTSDLIGELERRGYLVRI